MAASDEPSGPGSTRVSEARERLTALIPQVRPELHRYCARLAGSIFDGDDIVQDVLVRALSAIDGLDEETPLKPWLFRIAHNRALDHLRSQAVRRSEPLEAAAHVADDAAPDPAEVLMRRQVIDTALSRFTELPIVQRSVVVLKDVLGHSLREIAELLDLSVDAVKAALSRGRAKLAAIDAAPDEARLARPASAPAARFSRLFNQRDWEALRTLLAEDVQLTQATHPVRRGRADVGRFFTIYAEVPRFHLVPAHLDAGRGEEVIAVFGHVDDDRPGYLMKVEWRGSEIVRIRDFRHATYILEGADVMLAAPGDDVVEDRG